MLNISCPKCTLGDISKNGKNAKGEQRYICKNVHCDGRSFKLKYSYNGWKYGIGEQIIKNRTNDEAIRDIAKKLNLSKQKVQETLKNLQHQLDCLCKECK